MTLSYLLVGDIHLADRPPSSCTETYTDDLFDLLRQTVDLAAKHAVSGVIWAGDVFHVKAASRTSHRLVQATMELLDEYPCPVGIVPGNHDIEHDRLDSLRKQPLGVIFAAEAAHQVRGWPGAKGGPNNLVGNHPFPNVFGVPWQQDWNNYSPPVLDDDCLIVAHAPIYPNDRIPQHHDEWYDQEGWAHDQRRGSCFYGHVHDDHGIKHVRGLQGDYDDGGRPNVWFCNHGALTRGSLHESELTRQVSVTLWDPIARNGEGSPFRRLDLNAKPASEVFRLVEHGEAREAVQRLDDFLQAVGTTDLGQVTVEGVLEKAKGELPPRALQLIAELLEQAAS